MRASKRRRNCPHHIPGSKRYLVGARRVAVLGRGSSLALNLDLTLGVLPASIAFSRAGQAMLTDAAGNLTYAPNNLLTYSNTFSNAAWVQGALASIAISGSQWLVTENTANSAHYFYGTGVQQTPGVTYLASVKVQAGTQRYISLRSPTVANVSTYAWITFDTTASSLTANGSVNQSGFTSLGAGVYQIWMTYTTTASNVDNIVLAGSNVATAPATGNVIGNVYTGTSQTWYVSNATLSAVTYETTPRAGDQVVTGAAAYYGARFDYNPTTHAPLGLLVEGAATNLYLNSQAPATQGIAVTAQPYTISAYGIGTLTLSGAATGMLTGTGATTLVQMTVTPTAGTLTLTPSGTLTYVQVETGSSASSRIVTAGTSAPRAADVPSDTGAAAAAALIGPTIVETQSVATGTITRTAYAKNAFTWPSGVRVRRMAIYKPGTLTAGRLTVGGPW